jgi:hypothetical protein
MVIVRQLAGIVANVEVSGNSRRECGPIVVRTLKNAV